MRRSGSALSWLHVSIVLAGISAGDLRAVSSTPVPTSVTPASGSGASQLFSFAYTDPNGYADIGWLQAHFQTQLVGQNACYLQYTLATNTVQLINDAGTGYVGSGGNPGTAGTLSNSQCALNTGASSISGAGNVLTVNFSLSFTASFAGAKNISMSVISSSNVFSGWLSMGSWTATAPPLANVSVSPVSGSGSSQIFSFVFFDPNGYTDISWVQMHFQTQLVGQSACYLQYTRASNTIQLINDAGTGYTGSGGNPGATGTISNSQCTLNSGGSSVSGLGNNLTVNLALSFTGSFAGAKNVSMGVINNANLFSGWQTLGAWTVVAPVVTLASVSVTPASGSGASQTFSFVYSDPNGYSDINWVEMHFQTQLAGQNACYIQYTRTSNTIQLVNDAATGYIAGGGKLGIPGTLANSQCTLDTGASSASGSGNNLTVNLALSFSSSFAGAKNVSMGAINNANVFSGWQTMGSWTAIATALVMPVEVVGPDGFTKTTQLNVPAVPAGAVRLWLQIHGLRYQTQASVQVNNSGWLPVNDANVTLLGQAGAYGGIGGGFHTLTMTVNLPAGTVTAGNNTVSFRFNGTDGNVSGFRVLAFNFLGGDGSTLVSPTAFVNEDPNTWQPPSTQASDIAAGKALWYGAALTVPTGGATAAIRATCTSCHAQDGRDLKYFNYSNNSIRTRALFHGLTAQQGDQIASYIRSLNTPNPGRVWNPPYQPGPGLDSKPVEQWSAGAGLGAVLNGNQDLLNELFPNGIQASAFAATGNLNVRETSIPLQLPDWNSWLPTIHPLDAWGDEFTNSKYYQDYLTIRSQLRYADPVAYANANPYFQVWPGNYVEFLGPKVPNPGPNPDPNYWTPRFINEAYSNALWNMVKNWELNQEFGLEAMAKVVFTNPQADSRAWNSEFAFFTSPNMLHIPRGFPGLDNGKISTFVYLSFIWYHTQLILNNSNYQQAGTSPIDWPYVFGFIYEMAYNANPGQTGLLYLWTIKGRQISNNGLGPDIPGGWAWTNNDPSTQILQNPEGVSMWSGTSPSTQTALYESNVRSFLDVVEKFTPQQFYKGGAADPTVAPVHGNTFGSFGDRVWYTIPLLRYFGVRQSLVNEFAAWAQTVWPAANWSLTTGDTCLQGNSGITCNTYF